MPNPAPSDTAYLQLRSTPGSEIWIDGSLVCTVPGEGATCVVSGLPLGKNITVEARKSGYSSGWTVLKIPTVDGVLAAKIEVGAVLPTELTIATVPIDCSVHITGPSSGTFTKSTASQKLHDLPAGRYVIRAERDGRTVEETVTLEVASPLSLRMNLLDGTVVKSEPLEPVVITLKLEGKSSAPDAYAELTGPKGSCQVSFRSAASLFDQIQTGHEPLLPLKIIARATEFKSSGWTTFRTIHVGIEPEKSSYPGSTAGCALILNDAKFGEPGDSIFQGVALGAALEKCAPGWVDRELVVFYVKMQ